jgi:predicted nucleic acid-binding protein
VPDQPPGFVIDANVLIDFADSDPTLLALFSKHIGTIHAIPDVLENVEQISEMECRHLGIVIAEPTLEQYLEAGQKISGLAFDDKLCLLMARDNHWTLISNDKALRSACKNANIFLLWGLELMLPLVEKNLLSPSLAQKTADHIHSLNPKFVHNQILARFTKKIKEMKLKSELKCIKNRELKI